MPFGIPSEDFHGGFGLPHNDDYIEEYIHTPEKTGAAMKHISELMDKHRAEHPEVYEVNVEADKYADLGFGENWVSESPEMPDEDRELAEAAQEAYDNLVRSLIEAGGEIDSLKNDKRRLVYALKEAVTWLDYFLTTERDDIYYDDANEVRCRAEYLLMDLEG